MFPFTLQQLRILKAIATEKNFTKAAQVLYISQPSLSKQVKILEQNLDTLLINRENKEILLTKNGKILLQYSERILALCEESYRALIDLKNGDRTNLTIGTSYTIGTYLMPRILDLFIQNYPQIRPNVQVNSSKIILQSISNNEIDIAIIEDDVLNELKKTLSTEHFVNDDFSLIISKSHSFYKKKKIEKEELYCLNFITLTSGYKIRKVIDNILVQNQIETKQLRTILQTNSIESIKTAVNLGLGVAFVPSSSIEKDIKFKSIKTLEVNNMKITRELFIVTNSSRYKSKAFESFYSELARLKSKMKN